MLLCCYKCLTKLIFLKILLQVGGHPQDWLPQWPTGPPLCCFCREINKWAFYRLLSYFLFMFEVFVESKQLKQCRYVHLEDWFPCAQQRYYMLHWCFLVFGTSKRIFVDIVWSDEIDNPTSAWGNSSTMEWSNVEVRTDPDVFTAWKDVPMRWFSKKYLFLSPFCLFRLFLPGWETKG